MINIDFNIKQLVRQLEVQNNRDYKIQDIAKLSGINRFTIGSLLDEEQQQEAITRKTMGRLLAFFRSEGLDVGPGDLFVVTEQPGDR